MSTSLPAWKKNLPMWLTMSRILVCPFLILAILPNSWVWNWVAAGLFILASITDYFDGSLARRYQVESNLGKFMDPIADKILVASALVMLIPSGRANAIMVLILLARDILIGGVRSAAAADGMVISAKPTGKWKTGLQMVGIPALLLALPLGPITSYELGAGLLWISVFFSAMSGVEYTQLYWNARKNR